MGLWFFVSMAMGEPLLTEVTEEVLKGLPGIKMAYEKAEGDYAVVLDGGRWIRLSNRPFAMLDELFANRVSTSLERQLASGEDVVVCDLGAGYRSQAAVDILKKYDHPHLMVYAVDLFAQELPEKDPRLHVVRGNFMELSLPPVDIFYSWQCVAGFVTDHPHLDLSGRIPHYEKIVSLLKPNGEAFVDDSRLVRLLKVSEPLRSRFAGNIGSAPLEFPMGKWKGEDFNEFVYMTLGVRG